MTDPWEHMRNRDPRETVDDVCADLWPLLRDADALLAGNREARAQLQHLLLWLISDLSVLNRRELLEAVRRIAKDALAALPEHLK